MDHIQILNRDMLIPDPRFDFTYGRFIHLFDHNFAQESFWKEILKNSNRFQKPENVFYTKK